MVSPVGNDAGSTWDAALAGRSGVDYIQAFDTEGFDVTIAGEVKDFDPTGLAPPKEVKRLDRNVLFALSAAKEALADAGVNGYKPDRVGIPAWPTVPKGIDWKTGTCQQLGWPHRDQADIARAWKHVLGRVSSYADLEPALLGRVEELIDFTTAS